MHLLASYMLLETSKGKTERCHRCRVYPSTYGVCPKMFIPHKTTGNPP